MTCAEFDERLRSFAWHEGKMGRWVEEQSGIEACVVEGLRRSREREDWDGFERYVLCADIHPSPAYIETLGAVLDERREDVNGEAIVDALNRIRDPAAVPYLRRAIRFAPETDEFGQLGRKAVWALDLLHTPEALDAIREEVTDDLPDYVVEAAQEALAR
jgi:HEAT repeat protein